MNYIEIILDHERSKEERTQAAFHLAGRQDENALEALIKAVLTDPSCIVRHECAFVLGDKRKPYLGKYLAKTVKEDSSNIVIHEELSAFGTLGDPSYILLIRESINYPDVIVSETAEMAIERIEKYKGGKTFQ